MPDEGAESLTTNIYALHIAKLEKMRKYRLFYSLLSCLSQFINFSSHFDSFWCMACSKYAAAACKGREHLIVDLKKSRDEVQLESIQATANLNVALGKREMIIEYLEAEKKQLEEQASTDSVAELASVEKQLAENNERLEALRVKAQGMIDFKRFYPGRGQTVGFCYLMEQLQRENKEAMDDILQAEKILHAVSIRSKV